MPIKRLGAALFKDGLGRGIKDFLRVKSMDWFLYDRNLDQEKVN